MTKTSKIILVTIVATSILLGLGYAAIQNITLNITGTASASADQANFKVGFIGTPVVSDSAYATATITADNSATINVQGLTSVGDNVTATYDIKNSSLDLSADFNINTTNNNSEYFKISSKLGKSSLKAGETTNVLVTVELIKTPINSNVSATIGVGLTAMPVEPGKEGTSVGVNDYSQTPDNRNEFGFYFDEAYSAIVDGSKQTVIFHEDTSCEMLLNGVLMDTIQAGVISYGPFYIDGTNVDYGILTISSDGKKIDVEGRIYELDLAFTRIGKMLYGHYDDSTRTVEFYDSIPAEIRHDDICICGDYIYNYYTGNDGWVVGLLDEEAISDHNINVNEIDIEITDRNQTSYGPILEYINGKPVTRMVDTFEGCTKLIDAPKIPNTVKYMIETFEECTSLVVAPKIPYGVKNMEYAFNECSSLTEAPEIPNSVTGMCWTFSGCTSLTTAPEIPEGVRDMQGTFDGCASLITAPKIPSTVEYLEATFARCTSLVIAPEIPMSVTEMMQTFFGCTSLTTAPVVPSTVTNLYETFVGCTSLTGTITINTNHIVKNEAEYYGEYYSSYGCFRNVDMSKITLTGEATDEVLDLIGSTGENYTPII